MAESSRGWIVILSISAFLGLLAVAGPDAGALVVRVVGSGLLLLAVVSFFISTLYPRLKSFLSRSTGHDVNPTADIDHAVLQNKARNVLHDDHTTKATSYNERILKPRQEAALKRKEDDIRRNSGPAWQGQGHKLGTEDGTDAVVVKRGAGGSRDAAKARKLPEPEVTEPEVPVDPSPAPEVQPLTRKRVIDLPAEPSEDSPGYVTVMLRTPQGRFYQRRFDTSNKVQVLLDYMTTIGYHQQLYTLVSSYPRRTLDGATEETLAEAEITGRITLNVDKRDTD